MLCIRNYYNFIIIIIIIIVVKVFRVYNVHYEKWILILRLHLTFWCCSHDGQNIRDCMVQNYIYGKVVIFLLHVNHFLRIDLKLTFSN